MKKIIILLAMVIALTSCGLSREEVQQGVEYCKSVGMYPDVGYNGVGDAVVVNCRNTGEECRKQCRNVFYDLQDTWGTSKTDNTEMGQAINSCILECKSEYTD